MIYKGYIAKTQAHTGKAIFFELINIVVVKCDRDDELTTPLPTWCERFGHPLQNKVVCASYRKDVAAMAVTENYPICLS